MRVQEFDWIFDGDDVVELRFIDDIDDRRQCRTLAAAGRSGNQDYAVF